jgi:hypothetical protein
LFIHPFQSDDSRPLPALQIPAAGLTVWPYSTSQRATWQVLFSLLSRNEGLPMDYDELPLMAWVSFGMAMIASLLIVWAAM